MRNDRIRRIGGARLALGGFTLVLALACHSPSSPQQSTTAGPAGAAYRVSGTVIDDDGVAMSGVRLVLDHGPRLPDLNEETQRTETVAVGGRYELVLAASRVQADRRPFAMLRAWTLSNGEYGDFWSHAELLDAPAPSVTKNIRLRRVRRIEAGQSFSMTIEPDSSLCQPAGGVSAAELCEQVVVRYSTDGVLTFETRPTGASVIPTVRTRLTEGQGAISVPVSTEDFHTVAFAVAVPIAAAPQRYEVVTSLR